MVKILVCDGDSWTSGDIINPEINTTHVNSKENDSYRLPKVWPHKLGTLLNVKTKNYAIAGSSNDGIVRRTIENIIGLSHQYNSEDIFVIIGWSSPERKDFYYKGDRNCWETLYPAQLNQDLPKELNQFYKTYLKYFWNEEEYLNRYVHQNIYLHNFLKNKNIKHLFFDAFYEGKVHGIKQNFELHQKFGENKQTNIVEEYLQMRDNCFINKSFRKVIMERKEKLFDGIHPNEIGHEVWSKYIKNLLDE